MQRTNPNKDNKKSKVKVCAILYNKIIKLYMNPLNICKRTKFIIEVLLKDKERLWR